MRQQHTFTEKQGPGLRLPQPEGPTDSFMPPPPPQYLMTKAESSFPNDAILQFYNLYDGQSPKEQFNIL
jgi:hypothetical protein